MPAKSDNQQRFAAMSRTAEGRRRLHQSSKKPMPPGVAREFAHKLSTMFQNHGRGTKA